MKIYFNILLLLSAFVIIHQIVAGQTGAQDDGIKTREIRSSFFDKNRKSQFNPSKKPAPKGIYKGRKVIRAKAKRKPLPVPAKSVAPGKTAPAAAEIAQFGATMWRLRPEKPVDGAVGARLLKQGKAAGTGPTRLIAERVPFDTIFHRAEMVRLSFEVPNKGYLYVVDQEMGASCRPDAPDMGPGCTLSDPYLIFPTRRTRNGDNSVSAGTLVEIPAQTDDPSYFDIMPQSDDYAGELLTIIVSPTPLPNISIGDEALIIPPAVFADWQEKWGEDAAVFELPESENPAWTEQEKKAGAGGVVLNRDDPLPKTLFEVKVPAGRPYMVSFPMIVSAVKK